MLSQYLFLLRALRGFTIAVFVAASLELLRPIVFHAASALPAHAISVLFCAAIVSVLNLRLLYETKARPDKLPDNLIASLPEIACIIGGGGRFEQWNSNFETALGYTAQDIRGLTVFDTIAEEYRQTEQQTIARTLTDGMAKVESVLVAKNGTRIPCLLTGVRVVLKNAPCILGIAVDLRKLRAVEETLRASEEQYRSLIANIPDVVWMADLKGRVIFVSGNVEAMLGYTTAEVYQQGVSLWFDSIHSDDRQRVRHAFESLINDGRPYDIECRARTNNGGWLWLHDRAGITCDNKGTHVAAGLLSDITHRQFVEESLRNLASIVEFSEDAIIGQDLNGVISSWNHGAEKMYGYTTAEAVGRDWSLLVPAQRQAETRVIMERVHSGIPVECLETQALTKTGSV